MALTTPFLSPALPLLFPLSINRELMTRGACSWLPNLSTRSVFSLVVELAAAAPIRHRRSHRTPPVASTWVPERLVDPAAGVPLSRLPVGVPASSLTITSSPVALCVETEKRRLKVEERDIFAKLIL
uniref:Uncharacterized protein n=1 Tax=Zea mays TaxID=4577 RepID=A0A804LPM6_MAIZE